MIRNSVGEAIQGGTVYRKQSRMQLVKDGQTQEIHLHITASPFEHEGNTYVVLILEDISELIRIRSLLPICAHCKRIRNDEDYWEHLELYFSTRVDVDFSHGICPDCRSRLYPEFEFPEKRE